jgi:pyruvate carboxylase
MHARICARRQIEVRGQELRAFVVKQSVVRIHCVVAFAMLLIAAELFGLARGHSDGQILAAFIAVATFVIAASTRSIGCSVEAMKMENILRAPKAATVKATPAKAGDSLAVDQVIVEFE